MTTLAIELTDTEIENATNLLCRENETVQNMIARIIKSEIKSKKLRNDLGRK